MEKSKWELIRRRRTARMKRPPTMKLIDGLTKHAATIMSLGDRRRDRWQRAKDIPIGTLQARITASQSAQTTRATWQAAVVTDQAERTKTTHVRVGSPAGADGGLRGTGGRARGFRATRFARRRFSRLPSCWPGTPRPRRPAPRVTPWARFRSRRSPGKPPRRRPRCPRLLLLCPFRRGLRPLR